MFFHSNCSVFDDTGRIYVLSMNWCGTIEYYVRIRYDPFAYFLAERKGRVKCTKEKEITTFFPTSNKTIEFLQYFSYDFFVMHRKPCRLWNVNNKQLVKKLFNVRKVSQNFEIIF